MQTNRKKPIYGNCRVYHPDGTLMFLCLEKRINWYLDRNLAEIISQDPLSIKLNFEPKGKGAADKCDDIKTYMLDKKTNSCIICNEEDLGKLTKHHVIPQEYRRFFPLDMKSRSSHDIVILCRKHHDDYENNYAIHLKRQIEAESGIETINSVYLHTTPMLRAGQYARILMDSDKILKIPDSRLNYFNEEIKRNFPEHTLEEVASMDIFSEIQERIEENAKKLIENKTEEELKSFIIMWRSHFIESMNPKFISPNWNVYHGMNNSPNE
jgi:hypothetical protein